MEVDEGELVKTVSGGQQFKHPTSSVPMSLTDAGGAPVSLLLAGGDLVLGHVT